jgi:hypothetical protein
VSRAARARLAARTSALALLFALGPAACAKPPRALPPQSALRPDDAQQALAALEAARAARRSLRGSLRLALDGPEGSFRASQVLLLERPARLRVEVLGFLSQTVAVLTTDGSSFDLFRAEQHRVERGPVYPGLLHDVARIDLEPEEAVSLLLGVPTLPLGLHLSRADVTEEGGLALELVDAPGALRRRVVLGPARELREIEVRTLGGAVLWDARFDDYQMLGDASFAHRIVLRFPETGTNVEIQFQHVELDPEFDADAFVLRLPGVAPAAVR